MRLYSEEKRLNIFMCVLTVMMFAGAACCVAVCLGICARLNETVMPETEREHIRGEIHVLVCFISATVISSICMVAARYRSAHRAEKMERAIVEANARNDAKSDFLSMMSHEIRTPLNSIMGLSSLVRKKAGNVDSSVSEYLDKMDSASAYLLSLINDILDMSLIESGRIVLEKETFSLSDMVNTVAYIYRPLIDEKHQNFTVKVDIDNDTVICDKSRLAQVVMNLISNACKYTDENGSIELSVRENKCMTRHTGAASENYESAAYIFEVRDNGIGISESDIQRVLAPFEQVRDKRHSGGLKGTGLGLAISRNILYMLGSDICVKSVPGEGSVFSFEIVLEKGDIEDITERDEITGSHGISGAHILIVDDNEMNAEMLADILEEEGAKCDVCSNGMDALDIFRKSGSCDASGDGCGKIDAILMDIQMPVMDGLTAAEKIRKSGHEDAADVPIIAVTAFAFGDDIKKSMEAGMNAHVTKPVHLEEICSVMSGLIEKRKLMRM